MNEPLVLDTNALNSKDLMYWLRSYRGKVILPIIAYCEFCYYQIVLKRKTINQIDALLRTSNIEIRNMSKSDVSCVIDICQDIKEPEFKKNWRDYMIGAFAHLPPHRLNTENVDDFEFLGNHVIDPVSLLEKYDNKGKKRKRRRKV